jgi:ferredoxin
MRNTKRRYSFVYKQPENEGEESLCREAMEACPVEAIGDDGRRYQIKLGEE